MTELFFDIPGNPRPDNAVGGFLTTPDGYRLRYACFTPKGRPLRGTVVILPGRNECIEKYFETIRDLGERRLSAAILDWRGQGASDRLIRDPMRGHVASFNDYAADLEPFFRDVVLPDCRGPYFILAHSTGALVAMLAAKSLANKVRRMVLLAPFLGVHGLPMSMKTVKRMANTLYWIGLGRSYASGGKRPSTLLPFEGNKLTHDAERYDRNILLHKTFPQLALGGPTVSWLRAACMASDRVQEPELVANFRIPTLMIAAGEETIVSNEATEAFARRLKTASLITIDGAKHELLQEADFYREQLLAAFDAFVPGSGADISESTAAA